MACLKTLSILHCLKLLNDRDKLSVLPSTTNVVTQKAAKKSKDKMSRAEKKKAEKIKKAKLARGETVTDSEDDDWD